MMQINLREGQPRRGAMLSKVARDPRRPTRNVPDPARMLLDTTARRNTHGWRMEGQAERETETRDASVAVRRFDRGLLFSIAAFFDSGGFRLCTSRAMTLQQPSLILSLFLFLFLFPSLDPSFSKATGGAPRNFSLQRRVMQSGTWHPRVLRATS